MSQVAEGFQIVLEAGDHGDERDGNQLGLAVDQLVQRVKSNAPVLVGAGDAEFEAVLR